MKSLHSTPVATLKLLAALAALPLAGSLAHAQFGLTGTSYTQDFDSLGTALPTNWDVRTGGNSTVLGTAATFSTTAADWGATGGAFKNLASATGLASSDISATQTASTDRALGIRQTGAFGDPGAAFNFNFNASGKTFSALSIDLEMLSVQTRSTVWSLQYGLGASPTSFTTLGTYNDPGTFGTTTLTFNAGALAGMNNQANVWFRVVALTVSGTSGSRDTFALDNFSLTFAASGSDINIGAGSVFTASSFGGAAFSAGDVAIFNGTAGTVSLSGAVVAGSLKFTSNGYTLASPTASDTISTPGAIEVADGATATISGKITGANSLTKAGTGTLVLTNSTNDFVGNVGIGAGVLEVGSDAVLGAAANDIALSGGTLKPTSSLSLGAGRDLTGSGSVAIANGQMLTVNGLLNTASLTLTDSGTLAVNGSGNNTVGTLTLNAPASLTGNALVATGLTTGSYSGNATIANALNFGTGTRALSITGNLSLTGAVSNSNTTSYLTKTGPGTLSISGDTSGFIGGVQLGTQGNATTQVEGGQFILGATSTLGTAQMRLNSGTLTLAGSSPRTLVNSLSIGGRIGGVTTPTISGADVTFTGGNNSFFRATGSSGQLALNVNNVTTLTGIWVASTGTGNTTGVTLGGSGKLVIEGNAAAVTESWTLADTVTFQLKNLIGGGVTVGSGATLMGNGTVSGAAKIASGGFLAPGNSIGTMSFSSGLILDGGSTLKFELDSNGSTSDLLAITGNLEKGTGSSLIALDFGGTGAAGTYTLASFTALAGGFTVGDVSLFNIIGLAGGLTGTLDLQGTQLLLNVTGALIPEPAAAATLAGLGLLGFAATRRRRRQG
jgi:autotransporter-associated beta strand protein